MEDVAELVRDDSLELVPRQIGHAASRNDERHGGAAPTGGEGIDGGHLQDVDRKNGHSRSDRHLFHDVEEPSLLIPRGVDEASIEKPCHRGASLSQAHDLGEARGGQSSKHGEAHDGEKVGVPDQGAEALRESPARFQVVEIRGGGIRGRSRRREVRC
jgi:hypothetical protein